MALFKPFRGTRSTLPTELHDGYAYFCIDDGTFHIDYTDANGVLQRKQINALNAETLVGKTFDEIKAELTTTVDLSAYETKEDSQEKYDTIIETKVDKTALNNFYTKSEIDNFEFITVGDIDTICGGTIEYAKDVKF